MQCGIDIEIHTGGLVSKITPFAVFTGMQSLGDRQFLLGIASRLPRAATRWRLCQPGNPEATHFFRTLSGDRQRGFKIGQGHLRPQFLFFLAGRESIHLPCFIHSGFKQVRREFDFESGMQRCGRYEVIPSFEHVHCIFL